MGGGRAQAWAGCALAIRPCLIVLPLSIQLLLMLDFPPPACPPSPRPLLSSQPALTPTSSAHLARL